MLISLQKKGYKMSEVPIQLIVAAFKDEKSAKEALKALESEEGFAAGLAATPE
jgi:hypothetical protein